MASKRKKKLNAACRAGKTVGQRHTYFHQRVNSLFENYPFPTPKELKAMVNLHVQEKKDVMR